MPNPAHLLPRAVALTVALGLAVLPAAGQDADHGRQVSDAMDRMFNGSIVVGGAITDPDGRPLADVLLVIETGRFDPTQPSLRQVERRRETVTGAFRFACDECSDVRIRFIKEGYHSEVVAAEARTTDAPPEDERPVVTKSRLQVEMQPVVAPVELVTYRGHLTVEEGGEGEVLPLGDAELRRAVPLEVVKDLPVAFVRLQAGLDGDGGVRVKKDRPTDLAHPVDPVLDFSAADGGVVPYEPEAHRIEEIEREMSEAPAEGYQARLELDPSRDRPLYFYCRIGPFYGKGKVLPPAVERGSFGRRATAMVEIRLNPDRSRNLETVE